LVQTISATVPGVELRSADSLEGFEIVDLEVKHPDFDGIFTGTAESVYEELKALKPEVFGNETVEDAADLALDRREKRQNSGEVSQLNLLKKVCIFVGNSSDILQSGQLLMGCLGWSVEPVY
jgi:hypothetical protein